MSRIVTELPKTVENVGDILMAPVCVLHPKSAKKKKASIRVSWTQPKMVRYEVRTEAEPKKKQSSSQTIVPSRFGETSVSRVKKEYYNVKRTFIFSRAKDDKASSEVFLVDGKGRKTDPDIGAYPTVEHAHYLHILLCLFIENIKRGGDKKRLYFRFKDLLTAAGRSSKTSTKSIKSAIKRYQSCQVVWISEFDTGEVETLTYNIIKKSSLLNEEIETQTEKKTQLPTNRKEWNFVEFDEEIIETLNKNISRFLLTQTFKNLKPDTASVYRYYYALSDKSSGGRDIYHSRSLDFLMKVFSWESQKSKFKPWLESKFKELREYKLHPSNPSFSPLIEEPIWDHETAVRIRCKGYKEVAEKQEKLHIESSGNKKIDLNHCSNEDLLSLYYEYKADDLISKDECLALEGLLSVKSMQKSALDIIRKTIISLHTVSD